MKWKELIAVMLCCVPLFFFPIYPEHDWGDDAFQYLTLAAQINGDLNADIGLEAGEAYGPANKGAGFSLLLSVLFKDLHDLQTIKYMLTIALALTGLLYFVLLRRSFGFSASLAAALVFLYNYKVIGFRNEVMPEFLFMFTLALAAVLFQKSLRYQLFSLVLVGVAISFKPIGWAVVAGLSLYSIFGWLKGRGTIILNNHTKQLSVFILVPAIVVLLIQLLARTGNMHSHISWFALVLGEAGNIDPIGNLIFYKTHFLYLFEQEVPYWVNVLLKVGISATFLVGIIRRMISGMGSLEWIILAALAVLLVYPDQRSGIRFLLPLLPLFLFYAMIGASYFAERVFNARSGSVEVAFMVCMLFSNWVNWHFIAERNGTSVFGPLQPEAQAAFEHIREQLPRNAIVAFSKPWTVVFYGERSSVPVMKDEPVEALYRELDKTEAAYVLLSADLNDKDLFKEGLLDVLRENERFEQVFENGDLKLYGPKN